VDGRDEPDHNGKSVATCSTLDLPFNRLEDADWLGLLAAGLLAVALLRPTLLAPLNRLWMKFGLLLAMIINPIVLGILFFLVFTPMAFVARLVGKDFLRLKEQPEAKSYWIVRDPTGPEPASMKDQF